MSILQIASIIAILSIVLECSYSVYRKDNAYSLSGTLGNLAHGIILRILVNMLIPLYLSFFYFLISYFNLNTPNITVFSFIACLIIIDFSSYFFHRMNHSSNLLWIFHSVHHSDKKINLTTTGRISWLEQFYTVLALIPALMIGFPPKLIFLVMFWFNLYQFFCHNHYIKLPKFFDLLFITPTNHKIHHDQRVKYQNSNYGNIFSIWDRMFGTYTSHLEDISLGIENYKQDNFLKMETDPFVRYYKSLQNK